jgi:hypothetical protein
MERKDSQYRRNPEDPAFSDPDGVFKSCFFLGLSDTVDITLTVSKVERVGGNNLAGKFLKGIGIGQLIKPFRQGDGKMIITFRTDLPCPVHLFTVNDLATVITFDPETFRNPDFLSGLLLVDLIHRSGFF